MFSEDELTGRTADSTTENSPFINILLLGETGVGKSTFINSIANYLTYSDLDLEKVKKEELLALIPLKYTVQDKHGEYHIIEFDPKGDRNECLDTGMSATQEVRSYVFPIRNGAVKIRLIDTPGIGDVRGIDQDNTNCESILNYITQFDKLHAICYLFKPTNSRITVYFDYCLTQILSRLEKSARRNIIFIFTNTRGAHYGPGDTLPNLEKIIEDIKSKHQVDIPLDKNLFCFDNEAFRYLVSTKKNIQFDDFVRQRNCESWDLSADQCKNLIRYIIGDHEHLPLEPHFIESTSTINEVRRLLVQFSKLLSETSQLTADNVSASERQSQEVEFESHTLNELKQKLYMPVIDIDIIKLNQPLMVCASGKCTEIYKVGDINKRYYKQVCQSPCYLGTTCDEIVGHPELLNCATIDSSTKACKMCDCDFSSHMQTYYLTRLTERKILDTDVKKDIICKEEFLENNRKLITKYSKQNDELAVEYNTLVKMCNRFAHFLKCNVIVPFSDSYKEYIECLIMQEKSQGVLSNKSVVQYLQKLLQEYEPVNQFFSPTLLSQNNTAEEDMFITPQNVGQNLEELYKLKYNGTKIKEFYESPKAYSMKDYKYTEYVHEILRFDSNWGNIGRKNTNQKETPQHWTFHNSKGKCKNIHLEQGKREQSQSQNNESNQLQTRCRPRYQTRRRNQSEIRHETKSQTHIEDRRRDRSESPNKESDQSQNRTGNQSEILDNGNFDSQFQVLGNNQPKAGSGMRGRGRGRWQSRKRGRNQSKPRTENNGRNQPEPRDGESDQSQTASTPTGQTRGRGRGRGRWQRRNQSQPRAKSQTRIDHQNGDRSQTRSESPTHNGRDKLLQYQNRENDQSQFRSRPRGGFQNRRWQHRTKNNDKDRLQSLVSETNQSHSQSSGCTQLQNYPNRGIHLVKTNVLQNQTLESTRAKDANQLTRETISHKFSFGQNQSQIPDNKKNNIQSRDNIIVNSQSYSRSTERNWYRKPDLQEHNLTKANSTLIQRQSVIERSENLSLNAKKEVNPNTTTMPLNRNLVSRPLIKYPLVQKAYDSKSILDNKRNYYNTPSNFEVAQEASSDFGITKARHSFATPTRRMVSPQQIQFRNQSFHHSQVSTKKANGCCLL